MNDHTVLSLACAGGHLAVVELLLAHGADPLHKLKVRTTNYWIYFRLVVLSVYDFQSNIPSRATTSLTN